MINLFNVKKVAASFLFCILFWAITPVFASADTGLRFDSRISLQEQIKSLVAEVSRLQALLAQRQYFQKNTQVNATQYTPYKTEYFPLSFETIYLVSDAELKVLTAGESVRTIDKQLFDLFSSIIGKDEVKNYVREWRVFRSAGGYTDAFVELISGTDKWVVGVNRESFSSNDKITKVAFEDLFVHEYSHILLYNRSDFSESYKKNFWTSSDFLNQQASETASASNKFTVLGRYYKANQDRFISEYATMSPDEDMAETFVSFVREAKPSGYTTKERKILYFYNDESLITIRDNLRRNLALVL
jgi:hypothetical protein